MNKDQKFSVIIGTIVLAISLIAVITSYVIIKNKIPETMKEGRVYFNQLVYSTNTNCKEVCELDCDKKGYDGFGDFKTESAGRCFCECYKIVQ
ncbi:hypothetical protein J4481_01425 [Candidatus Pacearchaeota archaeon]|nr:hypothetical protein [Candidatus Pacearchaeota archaeon]